MVMDPTIPEWNGQAQLACSFVSEHTRTVRYKWCTPGLKGGFYVPRSFLSAVAGEAIPKQITVVLVKSDSPLQTIGFRPKSIDPRIGQNFWEYDLSPEVYAGVVRYDIRFAGQKYSIYVPKEIFGGQAPPTRLIVHLAAENGSPQ